MLGAKEKKKKIGVCKLFFCDGGLEKKREFVRLCFKFELNNGQAFLCPGQYDIISSGGHYRCTESVRMRENERLYSDTYLHSYTYLYRRI